MSGGIQYVKNSFVFNVDLFRPCFPENLFQSNLERFFIFLIVREKLMIFNQIYLSND